MPIENVNENPKMEIATIPEETLFSSNNTLIAGKIKVKHFLIDEPLVIYGFIIEDKYFNENDFKVNGMEISYQTNSISKEYYACNKKIYAKIILNFNKAPLETFHFATPDNGINIHRKDGIWYDRNGQQIRAHKNDSPKYILFEDWMDLAPSAVADTIMAFCKYRVDNTTKYFICNLHELTPVVNT